MTLLDAALDYAGEGWRVFPAHSVRDGRCSCDRDCNSPGKHPRTINGLKDGTTDEAQITTWWGRQWPDANIALVTGKVSNRTVLDFDGEEGMGSVAAHLDGKLPRSRVHTTPNGRHLIFLYTPLLKQTVGILPGVDIRNDGGYIIAPPSRNGEKVYEVFRDREAAPFIDVPAVLLKRRSQRQAEPDSPQSYTWVTELLNQGVPEKQRNNAATRLAGYFRSLSVAPDVIESILMPFAYRCNPPMDMEELRDVIKSVERYEPRRINDQPSGRFQLTALGAMFAEPEEDVQYVVDQMLPSGGLSVMAAKPKVGKTTLVMNLALNVARGEDFLGRTTSQGPVIYLALEEKRSEVIRKFEALGGTDDDPIYVHTGAAPESAIQAINSDVEARGAVLVIVDTLFKLVQIRDGNDYAEVTRKLEPLLLLARDTGCHVLTTHHAGKGERDGGDVILGSTAIFGAVDTAVTIKLKSGQRVIESHQRYGNDIPKTVLAFDEETFMITVAGELEALEIARAEQAILDALDHGAMTQADIREIEGFRTATLRKALTNLHESGRVSRAGAGRSGSPFYYEKVAAESPTDGP